MTKMSTPLVFCRLNSGACVDWRCRQVIELCQRWLYLLLTELKAHSTELEPVIALIRRSGCRIAAFKSATASLYYLDLSEEVSIPEVCKLLALTVEHDHLLPVLTDLVLLSRGWNLATPIPSTSNPLSNSFNKGSILNSPRLRSRVSCF